MPICHKKCSKSSALKDILNLEIVNSKDGSILKYASAKDIFLTLENKVVDIE